MKGVTLPALQKCDSPQKHRKTCLPKAHLDKFSYSNGIFTHFNRIGQGWKNVPSHNWSLVGGLGQLCWEYLRVHCWQIELQAELKLRKRGEHSAERPARPSWGLLLRAAPSALARGQTPCVAGLDSGAICQQQPLSTQPLLLSSRSCRQQLAPGSGKVS